MFIFFVILVLLIVPVIVYLYFSDKLSGLQRQLMFMARQNNDLKSSLMRQNFSNESVSVTYAFPSFNSCVSSEYCSLYLAPTENSPAISKIDIGVQMEVHDSAEIGNSIWYEVSLPAATRVNNKGWIKENSITKVT